MNLDDTLNIGATLPRQNQTGEGATEKPAATSLGDTLNIGATLPRQSQTGENAAQKPAIADLDDLENQNTIRLPGSGSLVFNRYRLQRVLGRGGMGVVWLGVDTKLERAVALKFLPDIVGADPVALKELKDETRRGLELAHPNIVRIYDFVDDDEAAAISMEFVDGKSLSERRLAKPQKVFSVEDIAPWVGQMCDALDYAHFQKRIVHRDLKPANLMVNSESEIKITDFGIARSVSDTMSRLTMHNSTSGTLLYMSPQQAMGDRPRPTDDIYALGATLYELLTGKPPFYSGDVSMQITVKTAPTLKARREEFEIQGAGEIPAEWEAAIAACLEKDPEKRPQSAGELARSLGLSHRAEAKVAAPVKTKAGGLKQIEMTSRSSTEEKKKSPMLAIVLASVAALLLLAGVGGGALWWWFNRAGEWVVQTEPAGAKITLNDKSLVSPATLSDLKPGSYKASIAMEGYEPRQVEFKVAAGQRVDLGVTSLERSTGNLLLSSDPDGATYEVKSATDEKAQKFTGETPDTVKLPVGRYSVVMKHDGELKTTDVDITRNVTSRQPFAFAKPPPPAPPAPVVVSTPPPAPAPAAVAAVGAPPAGPQTPPSSADAPPAAPMPTPDAANPAAPADAPPGPMPAAAASFAGSAPTAQTLAAAAQATAGPPAGSPVISAAPADGGAPAVNMAAIIAAQPAVSEPEAGYWKLSEILANSEYSGYSENGRGYIVYKAQQALKQSADGAPGKGTYKAIQQYQTDNGLQPTGQLDGPTLAALGLTGQPDKEDWGNSGGSSRGSSGSGRTPESEKTQARKFIERKILGGRDLKDMFRR